MNTKKIKDKMLGHSYADNYPTPFVILAFARMTKEEEFFAVRVFVSPVPKDFEVIRVNLRKSVAKKSFASKPLYRLQPHARRAVGAIRARVAAGSAPGDAGAY